MILTGDEMSREKGKRCARVCTSKRKEGRKGDSTLLAVFFGGTPFCKNTHDSQHESALGPRVSGLFQVCTRRQQAQAAMAAAASTELATGGWHLPLPISRSVLRRLSIEFLRKRRFPLESSLVLSRTEWYRFIVRRRQGPKSVSKMAGMVWFFSECGYQKELWSERRKVL